MSNYPNAFDTANNLYTVYDSLKVTLAKDYNPGDGSIFVDGDLDKFPQSGIITLIDQCSEPNERAVSFKYKTKEKNYFTGLELTDDSKNYFKPKRITNVMMQVRAEHHNVIKDAIIELQKYLGRQSDLDQEPYGATIIGRLNFLKKLLFTPKAWFTANITRGVVPFTVKFTSNPNKLKTNTTKYTWDFGNGFSLETTDSNVETTYFEPGIYDVYMKAENAFGEDEVKLEKFIIAKLEAPDEATIDFNIQPGQLLKNGILRTPSNQFVLLEVSESGEKTGDPIVNYSWTLGDNLPHGNSRSTKAAYSLSSIYNIMLKAETSLGSYRVTNKKQCIDVVEPYNLWLWNINNNNINAFEYGLNSETFKAKLNTNHNISINNSFLDDENQKKEFNRNNGIASSELPYESCELFWASGRTKNQSPLEETVEFSKYNGFTDNYSSSIKSISRIWNWTSLTSKEFIYLIMGQTNDSSPVDLSRIDVNLSTGSYSNENYDFSNGADELKHNPVYFDENSTPYHANYSSYRSTWKDNSGYLLRNVNLGKYFIFKNFYKTAGIVTMPFINLTKLTDIPNNKREAQIVSLQKGIFLFDNTGSPLVYKENTMTWEVVQSSPTPFSQLQDLKVPGYENESNSLLASSDGERKVFLSFDYSDKAFIKFNETNLTFNVMSPRPSGTQWQMAIF